MEAIASPITERRRPAPTRRRPALRTRAMAAFALLALLVSSSVAIASYQLTRTTLVQQRERVATRQTYLNARSVRTQLTSDPAAVAEALRRVQTSAGGAALLQSGGDWFSSSVSVGRDDVPCSLLEAVGEGEVARQRIVLAGGPVVATGVPLGGTDAVYVELVPLDEVDRTLARVARGLAVAVALATVAGLAAGRWLSGRILRPVRRTAAAANGIREGALDRRLAAEGDADLEPLIDSFNAMVDSLEARIQREARFASDVTHELRSPLATMDAALSVARRRATEPVALQALDSLGAEVARFQALIIDLLEIARSEAGVAELVIDEIDPTDLVRSVLTATGREDVEVRAPQDAGRAQLDKRRIGQVLVNLLDNADNYGGGATAITVDGDEQTLRISVDDDGPGVPEHERAHVFERFARGSQAKVSGTGLGLALVAEHLRLHRGRVRVLDAPGGGARFTIELPRSRP